MPVVLSKDARAGIESKKDARAGDWFVVIRPGGIPTFEGKDGPKIGRLAEGSVHQLLSVEPGFTEDGKTFGKCRQGQIKLWSDSKSNAEIIMQALLNVVSWNGAGGDLEHSKTADIKALLAEPSVQDTDIFVFSEFNLGAYKRASGDVVFKIPDRTRDFRPHLSAVKHADGSEKYADVDPGQEMVELPRPVIYFNTGRFEVFVEFKQVKQTLPGGPERRLPDGTRTKPRDGTVTVVCLLPLPGVAMLPLPVLVFAVHAGHNYDKQSKDKVVEELHNFIELQKRELRKSSLGSDECVVVVAGDFNEVGRGLGRDVERGDIDPIPGGSTHWCGGKPGERTCSTGNIDHIFVALPYSAAEQRFDQRFDDAFMYAVGNLNEAEAARVNLTQGRKAEQEIQSLATELGMFDKGQALVDQLRANSEPSEQKYYALVISANSFLQAGSGDYLGYFGSDHQALSLHISR